MKIFEEEVEPVVDIKLLYRLDDLYFGVWISDSVFYDSKDEFDDKKNVSTQRFRRIFGRDRYKNQNRKSFLSTMLNC